MDISGHGQAYCETGTEGVYSAVEDDSPEKFAYDKLYILERGDELTIFDKQDTRIARWHRVVDLEYESNQKTSALNPAYRAQAVFNHRVWGLQRELDPESFGSNFFDSYPMRFSRKAGWEAFHRGPTGNEVHRAQLQRSPYRDHDCAALLMVKYGLDLRRSSGARISDAAQPAGAVRPEARSWKICRFTGNLTAGQAEAALTEAGSSPPLRRRLGVRIRLVRYAQIPQGFTTFLWRMSFFSTNRRSADVW